jgi:uncharacterized protein (TIGR03437 family)
MKCFLTLLLLCQTAFCADYLTGQAARLEIGQQNFTQEQFVQPPGPNILGAPQGVAFANNALWVVDSNDFGFVTGVASDNRVLEYTPVSGFPGVAYPNPSPNTVGVNCGVCLGNPSLVVGQPDFTSYLPEVTSSGFYTPTAVATDGTVLAVADTNNNRVLIWLTLPTTNGQPADVVVGQTNFTAGLGASPPTASTLSGPEGVWIQNHMLFIADTFNNRVLIYNSIPTANGAAADVVLGQANFTSVAQPPVTQYVVPATQNNMSSPTSVTTDGTHLFVADLGHSRVLIWNSIPTTNNVNADVVVGQPDFISDTANNSCTPEPTCTEANSVTTTISTKSPNNVGVLCASTLTDSSSYLIFPGICGYTLSFPRFALADSLGRLYIADSGNDRVLGYNTIPTSNAADADFILGEPDEFTDTATGGTDALQSPSALAWDGTNLWVADTLDLRVLAFTPNGGALPLTSVRNGASQQIYATGTVALTGTPAAKDTVTITLGTSLTTSTTQAYTYTVVTNDTLTNIVEGLVAQINGTASGSTANPLVFATPDTSGEVVILTARVAGTAGEGTSLSATETSSSIVATASGTSVTINLASASSIAPGTLISIYGTGLSTQSASADLTQAYLPTTLGGSSVFIDGIAAPLLFVSPTQINAQMPFETRDRASVSVYVVSGSGASQTVTNAVGSPIVAQNPGIFAGPGVDPRPGLVYHYSESATGLILIDGFTSPGDVATVTIGANSYSYTTQASDTLFDIAEALTVLINATDPNVTASLGNEYARIILASKIPGVAGEGLTYTVSISTNATISLTAVTTNPGATTTSLCCDSTGGLVTNDNPAVPGEIVYTYATGLGVTNSAETSVTGKVITSSNGAPAYPIDSIVAGGQSAQQVFSVPVPGTVGTYQVAFLLNSGMTTDLASQLTIAQQLSVSNVVTFPVQVPASQ